ncbi:MAG: phosphoglucosamine mutase [Clostridia bacterium]|nr:phosphoglucosamine mutase [Clostridia bacterium]
MGRLFGTDGARGVANTEISCELAMRIGKAVAMVLTDTQKKRPRVLIGTDTRISKDMLEAAIACGLCSVGADVMTLGVVPTPAVAYLVNRYQYDAAVMISASHNPCEYNGIKIFKSDGYKLPDAIEDEIEAIILDEVDVPPLKIGGEVGRISVCENTVHDYIEHLKSTVDCRFDGMEIALDCANGSASVSAEKLFTDLGAKVHMLSDAPDGVNINDHCGSTDLAALQRYVKEHHLPAGFAFDGDADRMLAVDEHGDVVDGDRIIAICASQMKREGRLKGNTAVVTVMTNMGFYKYCEQAGIDYTATKVGDRYVLENMLQNGYSIGGEQSGHVIFLDYATTGDGQLTALQVLSVMQKTGKPLSELASIMTVYPQVMINVRVSKMGKARFHDDADIADAIRQAEAQLGDSGRVLVRVSGTEPLVRVMLEGKDKHQIDLLANEIAEVVREKLI